jgi:hypothetical protein
MAYGDDIRFWWETEEGCAHELLIPTVREVEERQFEIHQLNLRQAKLYSNRELMTLDWGLQSIRDVMHRPATMNTENLCASAVETLFAFIGKNRPKASIVTHDGSFQQRQHGELLDRYLYGEFLYHNVWEKLQLMFRDACVFGTGFLRVDIDPTDGEIFLERVLPDEVIVDQRECISGSEPLQMHLRRVVNRHVLRGMYPDSAQAIDDCKSAWISYRNPAMDYLVVVESWKRGPGGKHVVAIEGATLLEETYTRDRFPFVKFCYREPLTGFYGQSVIEQAMPYQLRLNRLNWAIETGQELYAVPRTFVDASSQVIKQQFDNEFGRLFYYRGQQPKTEIWQGASAELYAERVHIREQCWADLGLNKLSSSGELPQGTRLDSSKAIREANNINDDRHAPCAQRYERAALDVAEHIVDLKSRTKSKRKTVWRNGKVSEEIDWKEVDLKRDRYTMVIEASSILNMTPAARQDQLDEWANKGWISPEEARAMYDHPDLEASMSLTTAGVKNIEWTIYQLQKGIVCTPDPLQHLEFGVARVQMAYNDAMRQGADETILENMRRWIEFANHILNPPQDTVLPSPGAPGVVNPAPPPGAMGPGGPMPGMPPGPMTPPGPGIGVPLGPDGVPVPSVAVNSMGNPVR